MGQESVRHFGGGGRRWVAAVAVALLSSAVAAVPSAVGAVPTEESTDPGPLAGFSMVDAASQSVLADLADGSVVELADPDDGSYGIRADLVPGESVGSVSLALSGAKAVGPKTENYAPYSLYGDHKGWDSQRRLDGQSLPAGGYTLAATAYSARRLGGEVLGTLEVSFTVTTSESRSAPSGVSIDLRGQASDRAARLEWDLPTTGYINDMYLQLLGNDGVVQKTDWIDGDLFGDAPSTWEKMQSSLAPDTVYRYRVWLDTVEHGDVMSDVLALETAAKPSIAPEGLTATAADGEVVTATAAEGIVQLNWMIPPQPEWVYDEALVLVQRTSNGTFTDDLLGRVTLRRGVDVYSYEDKDVQAGETYHYRIVLYAVGERAYSNTAAVSVPEPPAAPSPPSLLTSLPDRVELMWIVQAQPESVTSADLEVLRDGVAVAELAWERGVEIYHFDDVDLEAETVYAYQVRITANGFSASSDTVEITTLAASPSETDPEDRLLSLLNDPDRTTGGAVPLNPLFARQGGGIAAQDPVEVTGSLDPDIGDITDVYTIALEDAYDEHTLSVEVTGLTASITVTIEDDAGTVQAQAANGETATIDMGALTLPYGTYYIRLQLEEEQATSYTLDYDLEPLDPWADARANAKRYAYYGGLLGKQQLGYYAVRGGRSVDGVVVGGTAAALPQAQYFTFSLTSERAMRMLASGGPADVWGRHIRLTLEDSEGRALVRAWNPGSTKQAIATILPAGTYYTRLELADQDDRCLDEDFYRRNALSNQGAACHHTFGMTNKIATRPPDNPDKSPDTRVGFEVPDHTATPAVAPPDDSGADDRFAPMAIRHSIDDARLSWEIPDLGVGTSISRYTLQRSDDSGETWADLHSSDTSFTAYTDRTVQPYPVYYYRLRLQTSDGEVVSPSYVSVNPSFMTVGHTYVKEIAKDSVTIAWHPVQDTGAIDGYRIYESYHILGHQLIATVGPDATEYIHTPLPNTPHFYSYRVVPFNSEDRGLWSYSAMAFAADHPDLREKIDGFLTDADEAPSGLSRLIFELTPGGDLELHWSIWKGATPTGFQIRRTMWNGPVYNPRNLVVDIIDVPGTYIEAYVDREFRLGSVKYEVRSVNEHGESPWQLSTCYPESSTRYVGRNGSQYNSD